MGRPPLGVEKTTVRLPKRIGARIDAVLRGREKRSDVIRQGLMRELERREAEKLRSTLREKPKKR
jgi:Arc/MetJ-type ribon-helix-helix transcriptional regulator